LSRIRAETEIKDDETEKEIFSMEDYDFG